MTRLFAFLFFMFFCCGHSQQKEIQVVKYEDLQKIILNKDKSFVIINFWATTCAPCIKELPHFMKINEKYKNNPNFKMLLVSLDRFKDKEKVISFLNKKNINVKTVLLDDIKRMNTWIPSFDENWGGEIPATIFYKDQKKIKFHNGVLDQTSLEKIIIENL